MVDYPFIKEILSYLEAYEQENDKTEAVEFALWLLGSGNTVTGVKTPESQVKKDATIVFLKNLHILYNKIKQEVKEYISESGLTTNDDYIFLSTLSNYRSLTKSELIYKHQIEFTSGTEVIRRLVKANMVKEFRDPADKRSRRVQLTPEGKATLYEIEQKITNSSKRIVGKLNTNELKIFNILAEKVIDN